MLSFVSGKLHFTSFRYFRQRVYNVHSTSRYQTRVSTSIENETKSLYQNKISIFVFIVKRCSFFSSTSLNMDAEQTWLTYVDWYTIIIISTICRWYKHFKLPKNTFCARCRKFLFIYYLVTNSCWLLIF